MAEYLVILDNLQRNSLKRQRKFRDRENPFDLKDSVLLQKYRFPMHVLISLTDKMKPFLMRMTLRSNSIPPHLQILIALRFFASESFQNVTGDVVNISQTS